MKIKSELLAAVYMDIGYRKQWDSYVKGKFATVFSHTGNGHYINFYEFKQNFKSNVL